MDLGLDSINIAPEFGLIETLSYIDKGIDIASVVGSGDGGRIIKRDIENHQPSQGGGVKPFVPSGVESVEEMANSQIDFFHRHYGQFSANARSLFEMAYAGRVYDAGKVYEHWKNNNN